MKKTIIAAISIILMLFAFVACDGEPTKPSETEPTTAEVTASVNDILTAIFKDVTELKDKTDEWTTEEYSGEYSFDVGTDNKSWTLTADGTELSEEEETPDAKATESEEETVSDISISLKYDGSKYSEFKVSVKGEEYKDVKVADAMKGITPPKVEEEEEPAEPQFASPMTGNVTDFGTTPITIADFQENVTISDTGVVSGTFKYGKIPAWGNEDNEGYYLFVKFNVDADTEVTVTGDDTKNAKDPEWILFLGNNPAQATDKKSFEVSVGNEKITLTFSDDCVFTPWIEPMEGSDDFNLGEGNDIGPVSKYQSDIKIAQDGKVTGTVKYAEIPSWNKEGEEAGYYVCVRGLLDDGDEITLKGETEKSFTYQDNSEDNEWIIFLGAAPDAVKAKNFTVKRNSTEFKLSFEGLTCIPKSKFATPMTETINGFDEGETFTVSDFQDNVIILENGEVTGNFKYNTITSWNDSDEDEGYYLFVSFAVEEGTAVTVKGDEEKEVADKDWILFLGTDPKTTPKQFVVTVGEEEMITLSLSDKCTFEEKQTSTDKT